MTRVFGLLFCLGAFLSVTAQAEAQTQQAQSQTQIPSAGETFYAKVPPSWQQVTRSSENGVELVAFVPPGQSAEKWVDMLSIQVIRGVPSQPLKSYYEQSRADYAAGCEDVRLGDYQEGTSNKYPAAFWVLACTRNKVSGNGETAFFRLIQGTEGLYLALRSWRTAPFAKDSGPLIEEQAQKDGVKMLQDFGVCIPNSAPHPCPR